MNYVIRKFFPHRWNSAFVLCVFLLFFAVGVVVHRDFGVSADEAAVRKFGEDAFNYLFGGGSIPTQLDWAFFNPAVPVFLWGMERGFGLTDGAAIWFLRHFITFLMFFGTVVTFYVIAKRRFHDWRLPLLGSAMFMLSPRVFAHGFYNPKDLPALFFFTLSAWTLLLFLENLSRPRIAALGILLFHVFCTALLISMRVFGLMMPVLAMMFLWIGTPGGLGQQSAARKAALSLVYILALSLCLALTWPLLWHAPLSGLLGAFLNTTSRSGGGFYFGESFAGAGVPWHYLPVWIGITTPVVYSLFFLIGFGTLWIRCVRNPLCLFREKQPTGLAFFWFTLPVVALMILRIGIFDEWRHMLFIYPALLLIALEGIEWTILALKKYFGKAARWAVPGILALQLVSTGSWMAINHPFEYAYFSIPTRFIEDRFDLDYWGLSYRAGLEWIAENDGRDHINVFTSARVGKTGADTLPYDDWDRLYFTTPDKADYILDNFRVHGYKHLFPEYRKVHAVTVDGLEILGVYGGPDAEGIFEPIVW